MIYDFDTKFMINFGVCRTKVAQNIHVSLLIVK